MDKGYYPNWTDVVYTIDNKVKGKHKPMYMLQSLEGTKFPQKFYPEEVQKIRENLYRIEKIIKRETRNGRRGFIVKWLNYPESHNSWVPEADIINLNAERSH